MVAAIGIATLEAFKPPRIKSSPHPSGRMRFPSARELKSTSRMSQTVSKRLTRMTHRMTTRLMVPAGLPDVYKAEMAWRDF
jgi:hypothetical protein